MTAFVRTTRIDCAGASNPANGVKPENGVRSLPKAAAVLALLLMMAGAWAQATTKEVQYLFQRARLAPSSPSAMVVIDFAAGQWRVGAIDGPVATEAELRAVLGDLQGIVVSGSCANAAAKLPSPCAFALRHPDLAGVVEPWGSSQVLGWTGAAGPTPGAGQGLSVAQRYFALLDPMRYTEPLIPGVSIAFRYLGGAQALMPVGFDTQNSALILHNDRSTPLAPQTYAIAGPGKRSAAGSAAALAPLRLDLPPAWAIAVSSTPARHFASAAR